VERLFGSIHRECLDHTLVPGEAHLRRIMTAYEAYYNTARTHLSMGKANRSKGPPSPWLHITSMFGYNYR